MFYLVLRSAGGYQAGEVLDLGDGELAESIQRVCGLQVLSAEEAAKLVAAQNAAPMVAPALVNLQESRTKPESELMPKPLPEPAPEKILVAVKVSDLKRKGKR